MKESIICFLIRALTFIFKLLPIRFSLFIGRVLGVTVYYLSPKRAGIAYRNLRCAFGEKFPPEKLRALARGSFSNLGMNAIETLCIEKIDKKYVDKFIKFEGREYWDEAMRAGRGAIMLTGHVGNWELSSIAAGIAGYKIFPVARAQIGEKVTRLLYSYREKKGATVIDKEGALRKILAALKENGSIGLLLDQDAGVTGAFADLFGRYASVRKEPLMLAIKRQAAILPVFIQRIRGPYHLLKVHSPVDYSVFEDKDRAVQETVNVFNSVMQERIRDYPSQWLWAHKRWKSTPTRKVVILNDGKAGHLNQSKALAQIAGEVISSNSGKYADIEEVDIKFKSRLRRGVFTYFYRYLRFVSCFRFGLLKFALDDASYKSVAGKYADIVISTGSALSALNLFLKQENRARSIVCFKPQGVPVKSFDMVVAGEHDASALGAHKNTVYIKGALSVASDADIKAASDGLLPLLKDIPQGSETKKIGILIGGNTGSFTLNERDVQELFDALQVLASKRGVEFIITTSRRTCAEVEAYLKRRFSDSDICRLLIIANENNPERAVSGIIGLSDLIIATADSISMVSEAAASKVPVIIYKSGGFSQLPKKHICIVDNFVKNNIIKFQPAEHITRQAIDIFDGCDTTVVLDNREIVKEKLQPVLNG